MKPHQIIAREALLTTPVPLELSGNIHAIKFAEGIGRVSDDMASLIDDEKYDSYKEGETLGFENGKQNMLDDMADWFEDIDTAAEEFIESVNAELSEIPHSVQIAIDKFKESLAEFSKRMEGKS